MNQRAMGEESVISLQDLGDAMRVCVWCVLKGRGAIFVVVPPKLWVGCWAVARSEAMRCDATSGLSSLENGEADDGDDGAVVGVLFERNGPRSDGRPG